MDWFRSLYIDAIIQSVQKHKCVRGAIRQLQAAYPVELAHLDRATVSNWFTAESREARTFILKDKYQNHLDTGTSKSFVGGRVSKMPQELQQQIVDALVGLRKAGTAINTSVARAVIYGIIKQHMPELLTTFLVSPSWVKNLFSKTMKWSWRTATTTRKLPREWNVKVRDMVLRVAYIVKKKQVPPRLVINSDQVGQHLVAGCDTGTFAESGAKTVEVVGSDDKRMFTFVVSSDAEGTLLPFQVVLQGKDAGNGALRALNQDVVSQMQKDGHRFEQTSNHWSNLTTMKQIVKTIIDPAIQRAIRELTLPADQIAIWLIDCWKVGLFASLIA